MPIDDLLKILRNQADPVDAWQQMLELFGRHKPSGLWLALPQSDLVADGRCQGSCRFSIGHSGCF